MPGESRGHRGWIRAMHRADGGGRGIGRRGSHDPERTIGYPAEKLERFERIELNNLVYYERYDRTKQLVACFIICNLNLADS